MAKKNAKREEQWAEAKRRCRLSAEQLRRAREMGLNPVSLLKNIPAPTQQWKAPVGDWVDSMYEKRQKETARKQAKRAAASKAAGTPSIPPSPGKAPKAKTPKKAASGQPRTPKPSRDPHQYRIRLTTDFPFGSDDDDSYLLKYQVTLLGDIDYEDDDVDEPNYVPIGDLRVWRFLVGAHREKAACALFDLFDADSDEAMQLFHAVFDLKSEEPKPALAEAKLTIEFPLGTDVLYFQWGDLPADYRRSDVALAMVERTIDALGSGCFAATLWPWDAPVPDPETASSAEVLAFFESQQANEEHWGKIGFKRIPGTAILIRDLNQNGWNADALLEGNYEAE